jgi:hypothetical protein
LDQNKKTGSKFKLGSSDIGGIVLLIALPIFWFLVPAFLRENGLSNQLSSVLSFEAAVTNYVAEHMIFVPLMFGLFAWRAVIYAYRSGKEHSAKPDK